MRALVLCCFVLALPGTAHAATLVKSGSTLTYTAAPGGVSAVSLAVPNAAQPTTVRVSRAGDGDPIQASGCGGAGDTFTCDGITRIVMSLGDGDDLADAGTFSGAVVLDGGPGDDQLAGGAGPDTLIGGPGLDTATYVMRAPTPAASVSLDDVADDGVPGEGDNYSSDLEDVSILGRLDVVPSGSTLIGSAGPNELLTGPGNDLIVAGAGIDRVTADAGDDTIDVRDGFSDRVRCGPGSDSVTADTLDLIGADCEAVAVADAGNALDDRPPTIAWATPKANAKLRADPANPLTVTAADDRGIALVRFLDDDDVVCEITTPPYTCNYRANTGDVGRNTLSAVAVDTAGQTTTIQRAVTVSRFRPPLKLTVKRGFRLTGRLETAGRGCRGTVTVRATVGKRTLAKRKVKLTGRCTYKTTIRIARRSGLRFRARFGGNSLVMPRAVSKAAPR
jgi:hypothetical protein